MSDETPRLALLLRHGYEALRDDIYGRLADAGFPEIRPAHGVVLRNMDMDGTRVADLARRANMTKQSMAYLTQSLQDIGLVDIGPDPEDRRAKRVCLTPRGREAYDVMIRFSNAAEARYAKAMGKQQMAQLRALLVRLNEVARTGA